MIGDPHPRLIRALLPHAGVGAAIVASRTRPWASATFAGMRHRLTIRTDAEGARRLDRAGDAIVLPGHILIDLREVARHPADGALHVEIDAMTVEAG